MIDRACISLTERCNLRCRYCHFRDKQNDGGDLSGREAVQAVDNIWRYVEENKLGSFKLGIVGSGEPLLELRTMVAMLERIESYGTDAFRLYTITNGTLASEEALGELLPYKDLLNVCFSLDGPKEVHNAGRSSFEAVMEGVANYRKVYRKAPSINATANLQSFLHKEETVSFFQDNELKEVTFSRLVACEDESLKMTDAQFAEFMDFIKDAGIASRQFRAEKCYDCTMYGRFCGVGRTNIFISRAGVYPCGRFYKNEGYRLGSFDEPLAVIEERQKRLAPVEDGKCYYEEVVVR